MKPDAGASLVEKSLKVLIADDHPLILQGLRRTVEAREEIDVVGEAQTGAELLALVKRRQPDVVLMDLRMPGLDGIDCIREIRQSWPEIKVVVLSACEDRAPIDSALAAGASAYVVKTVHSVDIPSVLRQVAAGGVVFQAPENSARSDDDSSASDAPSLTERELTILAAVAEGMTTKAISGKLWLSEHTVKFHLTNIYRKLGVTNRSGAVRYAFEHGLVSAAGG
jgi:DNA-binding NarL/FixJ family response regulator